MKTVRWGRVVGAGALAAAACGPINVGGGGGGGGGAPAPSPCVAIDGPWRAHVDLDGGKDDAWLATGNACSASWTDAAGTPLGGSTGDGSAFHVDLPYESVRAACDGTLAPTIDRITMTCAATATDGTPVTFGLSLDRTPPTTAAPVVDAAPPPPPVIDAAPPSPVVTLHLTGTVGGVGTRSPARPYVAEGAPVTVTLTYDATAPSTEGEAGLRTSAQLDATTRFDVQAGETSFALATPSNLELEVSTRAAYRYVTWRTPGGGSATPAVLGPVKLQLMAAAPAGADLPLVLPPGCPDPATHPYPWQLAVFTAVPGERSLPMLDLLITACTP